MVSTAYLRVILNQTGVFQRDIAEEWGMLLGRTKTQPRVSAELEKESTDSISFLKSISNLTKIPMGDILSEVSESKSHQGIVYTPIGDLENEVIPISNSLRGAASSLLSAVNETTAINDKEFVSLPKNFIKPGGVKMLLRITGESMSPTFNQDDYVACRLLEEFDWSSIQDERVYLIVNKDNETFLKRVKNRLKEYGLVVCKSDNLDKKEYPDFNLELGEISQIWDVQIQMKWKFPNPHTSIQDQFKEHDLKLIDHDSKIKLLLEEMKKIKNEVAK